MKTELEDLVEQMISRGIFFDEAVKEFEKKFILNTLTRYNHNLSKAATALGIHRNTLSKRLIEYQKATSSSGTSSNGNGKGQHLSRNGHKNTQKRRQISQRTKSRS